MTEPTVPIDGLNRIVARSDRDHFLIRMVIPAMMIIVLALVLAFGLLAQRESQVAARAVVAKAIAHQNCLNSNNGRDTERNLWNYLLGLPSTTGSATVLTPAEKQAQATEIAAFKTYLATNLGDRPCP